MSVLSISEFRNKNEKAIWEITVIILFVES